MLQEIQSVDSSVDSSLEALPLAPDEVTMNAQEDDWLCHLQEKDDDNDWKCNLRSVASNLHVTFVDKSESNNPPELRYIFHKSVEVLWSTVMEFNWLGSFKILKGRNLTRV